MSKKRLRIAQKEVLQWLQGRVEDQFVRAYISNEIVLLERIGYPINSSGTELTFEVKKKVEKPLPGQTNIMEALEENGTRTRHGECSVHGRISTDNGTLEIKTAGDGTTIGQRCGLCNAATNKLPTTNGEQTS